MGACVMEKPSRCLGLVTRKKTVLIPLKRIAYWWGGSDKQLTAHEDPSNHQFFGFFHRSSTTFNWNMNQICQELQSLLLDNHRLRTRVEWHRRNIPGQFDHQMKSNLHLGITTKILNPMLLRLCSKESGMRICTCASCGCFKEESKDKISAHPPQHCAQKGIINTPTHKQSLPTQDLSWRSHKTSHLSNLKLQLRPSQRVRAASASPGG